MKRHLKPRYVITPVITALIGWLIYYIASNTEWREVSVPMPLRGEAATNRHYAFQTFMRKLGVEVHVEQTLLKMPPNDAVIILNEWHWDLIDERAAKLKTWVQNGGRLVVDDSLFSNAHTFNEWSGLNRKYPPPKTKSDDEAASAEQDEDEDEDLDELGESDDSENSEDGDNAIKDAINKVTKKRCFELTQTQPSSEPLSYHARYQVCSFNHGSSWMESTHRPTWSVSNKSGMQALRVAIDHGSVTLMNSSSFDNRDFVLADNAALMVAITQLRHNDKAWFLTEEDHPSILTLAWRYGAPVVIVLILFIVLALWRNGTRFGPKAAPTLTSRRSLAELIRGSGWFLIRQTDAPLLDASILRALNETAIKHIHGYASMPPVKQADAIAKATGLPSDSLLSAIQMLAHTDSTRSSPQRERRAIALIETARRRLVTLSSKRL